MFTVRRRPTSCPLVRLPAFCKTPTSRTNIIYWLINLYFSQPDSESGTVTELKNILL
jgi:hypothetical protein